MTVNKDSSNIAVGDGVVTINGWVQDIRNMGGIAFLQLRDRYGVIQVTMPKKKIDPELFASLTSLSRESVVSITGEVKESNQTALGLEVIPSSYVLHSEAGVPLPMGVIDKVNVEMDTRLNNRFMDLRKPEVKAIFELKSLMVELIEEAVRDNGFTQVYTPKISAAGAEGGAELFKIKYFDKDAFLSQSPQLYKQVLMSTGLDRVFEIAPAFRAELECGKQTRTFRRYVPYLVKYVSFPYMTIIVVLWFVRTLSQKRYEILENPITRYTLILLSIIVFALLVLSIVVTGKWKRAERAKRDEAESNA